MHIGKKIKILRNNIKTIKELDTLINNEFKNLNFGTTKDQI